MFYLVPPTGTSITPADINRIIKSWISSDSQSKIFDDLVKKHADAKYCFMLNSGRTALVFILNSFSRSGNKKNEVIMPAYTCFSVAAAVARSGLKIRLVDIDPLTLDYNYEILLTQNFDNVLAIIGCNLFGILSDWNRLKSIAIKNNVYLIDDAAQSMGTSFQGRVSGSLCDVGFYSLGRGKNLSTVSGGIVITDNEHLASNIYKNIEDLSKPGLISNMKMLLNIILYSIFLNPKLYWLPDKMPFLKLGQTVFDEHFIIGNLSDLQKCAGIVLFPKLDNINAIRSKNARAICEGILADARFRIPGYSTDRFPIYLRIPVLARNSHERDKTIAALKKVGIKSSSMYPTTIRRIEGIERYLSNPEDDFEGAQAVVDRLFTLPTHHYVKDSDIKKIIDCLKEN